MSIYDDIDDGVFEFKLYGKCVLRPKITWDTGLRNDIIIFYEKSVTAELTTDLCIGSQASPGVRERIIEIIKRYWDYFCVKGYHRTIIGCEISIDIGDHTPVCCRKSSYGIHESKIILK